MRKMQFISFYYYYLFDVEDVVQVIEGPLVDFFGQRRVAAPFAVRPSVAVVEGLGQARRDHVDQDKHDDRSETQLKHG